jgi:hypothetical protein
MARGDGIWLAYSLDGTIMVPFGDRVKCLEHAVANQLTYRRADFGVNLLTTPAQRAAPAPAGSLAAATGTKGRKPSACSVCGLQGHRRGSARCKGADTDMRHLVEDPESPAFSPVVRERYALRTERHPFDQATTSNPDGPVLTYCRQCGERAEASIHDTTERADHSAAFGIDALRASADRIAAGEQAPAGSPGATLGPSALLDHLALTEARASVELDRDQTHVVESHLVQLDSGDVVTRAEVERRWAEDGGPHPDDYGPGPAVAPQADDLDPADQAAETRAAANPADLDNDLSGLDEFRADQ